MIKNDARTKDTYLVQKPWTENNLPTTLMLIWAVSSPASFFSIIL